VCAVLAGFLNAGSFVGLTMGSAGGSVGLVHLAVMALGITLFLRVAYHQLFALRYPRVQPATNSLPSGLVWGAVASLCYTMAMVAWLVIRFGEGGAEVHDGREVWVNGGRIVRDLPPGSVAAFAEWTLRVFSASWLFFALLIALIGHRVEERIRGYRAARGKAGG
jgi:hypothetical protein